MRVIKGRTYAIKNRIAFAELPDIARAYLAEQGLRAGRFMFYFEDFLDGYFHSEPISCRRALKDMPELGEIHILDNSGTVGFATAVLSNMADNREISDQVLVPYMKKLQRTYGFNSISLCWSSIDFFGCACETVFDRSWSADYRKRFGTDPDPLYGLDRDIRGSMIRVGKDQDEGSTLTVTVDSLRNDGIADVLPYFSAMNEKLPKVRYHDFIRILLSDGEKETIDGLKNAVEPLVEKCRGYFASKGFEAGVRQRSADARYALGEKINRISKQYGFTKRCIAGGTHELMRVTPNGHILAVHADSGPSHYNVHFECAFVGTGYTLYIGSANFIPQNQAEFDNCADRLFEALEEFSHADAFGSLDKALPPSPDWFLKEPVLWFDP